MIKFIFQNAAFKKTDKVTKIMRMRVSSSCTYKKEETTKILKKTYTLNKIIKSEKQTCSVS